MVRVVAISDTHNKHKGLEVVFPDAFKKKVKADIIVHSGDLTGRGSMGEVQEFFDWYGGLTQFKHRIVIAGNHDWLFEKNSSLAKEMVPNNVIYLEDSGCEVMGLKFWGSPQTPEFFQWAFNRMRGEDIKRYWDIIPDDTDYLITHGPANGVGDYIPNNFYGNSDNVGCEELVHAIHRVNPIVHQYGHIHCAYTYQPARLFDTISINASVLNESYAVTHEPIVLDIDPQTREVIHIDLDDL
jgi:Icc-related predicted phosphoesterase